MYNSVSRFHVTITAGQLESNYLELKWTDRSDFSTNFLRSRLVPSTFCPRNERVFVLFIVATVPAIFGRNNDKKIKIRLTHLSLSVLRRTCERTSP